MKKKHKGKKKKIIHDSKIILQVPHKDEFEHEEVKSTNWLKKIIHNEIVQIIATIASILTIFDLIFNWGCRLGKIEQRVEDTATINELENTNKTLQGQLLEIMIEKMDLSTECNQLKNEIIDLKRNPKSSKNYQNNIKKEK